MAQARQPNILITGTPGTGKTTTAELVAAECGLVHLNVGKLVKEHAYHQGRDEEFDSYILDEDKLLDHMEVEMEKGGRVVDYHSCELFPERWFDLVVVLQADTNTLYTRLEGRQYRANKIQENMQCEIMQVVLEEARESYAQEVVVALPNNCVTDLEENVERIAEWTRRYRDQHQLEELEECC